MTDLISAEEAQKLLDRGAQLYNDAKHHQPLQVRCADLARTVIDLHAELEQALADAKAAVAVVVEKAAAKVSEIMADSLNVPISHDELIDTLESNVRALAPEDAIAEVSKLRAVADSANQHWLDKLDAEAERDRLAAANAREAGLRDFVDDFAKAKIDALRYQPAYGESPEDEPDPVVDAETVWAWQADAKAALAQPSTEDTK